ncbi:MAG: strawberry notch C-terminal domain-containing protein [Rhodobacteraceae bacterium]|nr:strawberry notch C-terminal domain-containing protein [Paracoccaceae bacterium]
MSKRPASGDASIKWVVFNDNCAVLRRMVRSSGAKGLLLQFTSRGRRREVRRLALEAGFLEFGDTGDLYLMAPARRSRFDADALAKMLGGVIHTMPRQKLESYPWTIDYTAPDKGKANSYRNIATSQRPEFIGRNFRGEGVFRDANGFRSRKVRNEAGKPEFIRESGSEFATEFLRSEGIGDLPAIAAGLLAMAETGSVSEIDFQRVAIAAQETLPGADVREDRFDAAIALRKELLKQIVEATLEEDGSRDSYRRAMKLAENSHAVIDPDRSDVEGLNPSASLLIFLRRLNITASEIEFLGNSRLGLATPLLKASGNVSHQLCDLTTGPASGIRERVINILAGRCDDGSSTLIVSGSAESAQATTTRSVVGKSYALETVAEISPLVATGRHEQEPVTLFMVGERRPELSEGLPLAALRTFSVFSRDDLDRLHTEILRSRRKIRDWHRGIGKAAGQRESVLEDNERQRPYVALSQTTTPFTMIPKSLDGATAKALQRVAADCEKLGGVDTAVANSLGISPELLGSVLTAEQVDAVAMRNSASSRNRGFLLGDQTGIGKGRSLAAMARLHIREGGRVLYLTENAEINIPDVWRDLEAVGALAEIRPVVLAGKPVNLPTIASSGVPPGKTSRPECYTALAAAKRKVVFESGEWPPGCNMILTNYSLFSRGPDSPAATWASTAPDVHTLLILDESHNAINPSSNTGKAVRNMIELVGRRNVVYATATPMRNPAGANLYIPLLPDAEGGRLDRILADLAPGGETAQESFATMLGEDGTYLRRDHDLSNLEFEYRLPDDGRIAAYQEIMNRMTPVVELMIDASLRVGALVGRAQSQRYAQMINDGVDEQTARTQCNALFQYSGAIGSPLVRLARVTINAIKVDQVVEEAVNELNEGRKPLITFHSTGASLFNELAADNQASPDVKLSLSDQIARVAESIFRIKLDDQIQDARQRDREIGNISHRLSSMIAEMPDDLPASPVDSVIEKLAELGFVAGEISGRSLAYRDRRIVRRSASDRRSVVDAFNDGGIDVLIYNSAGATGGSYHASPDFGDPRPRTLIEMETPVDIIKYIQSQGRGNRYGQIAKPRIVSVLTGLIPEMRILQQRNRKLRALGASVDGNRSHPLLMDDVPDLLNRVGDRATAQILRSNPDLARRLGFTEFLSGDNEGDENQFDWMMFDSGASKSLVESIANKALTRSLVLSAADQERLVDLITIEFEAIIEELESRNSNPLRPKEMPGEVEIHATTLFSGVETEISDLETSAFFAPLYISTGTHHMNDEPITGDQLLQMVERSRITDGTDGFSNHATRIETMMPTILAHLVPSGMTIAEALATPNRFHLLRNRHALLVKFIELLQLIRPGVVLEIDGEDGGISGLLRTVVKLTMPREEHLHLPQAYRVRTVCPGDGRPEIHTLKRLLAAWPDGLRIHPGLSMGVNELHMQEFANQLNLGRRYPVQVLSGNLLAAITEAQSHKLGTMSLFREMEGQMRRGIVVDRSKVDLDRLPAIVPSCRVAVGLAAERLEGRSLNNLTIWIGRRERPEFSVRFSNFSWQDSRQIRNIFVNAKRSFLKGVPQLEADFNGRTLLRLSWPEHPDGLERVLNAIEGHDMLTDGVNRNSVNSLTRIIEEHGGLPPEMELSHIAAAAET